MVWIMAVMRSPNPVKPAFALRASSSFSVEGLRGITAVIRTVT
jgi:hypothetical protein